MRRSTLWIAGALVVAGGCSHNKEQTSTEELRQPPGATAETQGGMTGAASTCPLQLQGTTLQTENTDNGIALKFTSSGNVAQLRSSVQRLASLYTGQSLSAMTGTAMPNATVREEDIDNGARLVFDATDSSQVDQLQQSVSQSAQQLACAQSMQGGMQQQQQGAPAPESTEPPGAEPGYNPNAPAPAPSPSQNPPAGGY